MGALWVDGRESATDGMECGNLSTAVLLSGRSSQELQQESYKFVRPNTARGSSFSITLNI